MKIKDDEGLNLFSGELKMRIYAHVGDANVPTCSTSEPKSSARSAHTRHHGIRLMIRASMLFPLKNVVFLFQTIRIHSAM